MGSAQSDANAAQGLNDFGSGFRSVITSITGVGGAGGGGGGAASIIKNLPLIIGGVAVIMLIK